MSMTINNTDSLSITMPTISKDTSRRVEIFIWDNKYRRGPAQDITFFYTGSHLSELQSCTLIYQPIFILFSYLNSAQQSLVIELYRALIIFHFCVQVFSKLTHIFWLLNYWIYHKCKIPLLLLKRALSIWDLKKYIPYVKIIDFLIFV